MERGLSDSIEAVLDDVEKAFEYRDDRTYQDRAHEYMQGHGLMRDGAKTAVRVEVEDLVNRAYEAGKRDAKADCTPQVMEMIRISGELFKMATELKEA